MYGFYYALVYDVSTIQEAFRLLGEAEANNLASHTDVVALNEETRNLKRIVQGYGDAREFKMDTADKPLTSTTAMLMLESGSNLLKAVVKRATTVKAAISLARQSARA